LNALLDISKILDLGSKDDMRSFVIFGDIYTSDEGASMLSVDDEFSYVWTHEEIKSIINSQVETTDIRSARHTEVIFSVYLELVCRDINRGVPVGGRVVF